MALGPQECRLLPCGLPLNTRLCLGEAAGWVHAASNARVQNCDAAALESCPASPTSRLQQGLDIFGTSSATLQVRNPDTTGWHLPQQAVLPDLWQLGPSISRVGVYRAVLRAGLLL